MLLLFLRLYKSTIFISLLQHIITPHTPFIYQNTNIKALTAIYKIFRIIAVQNREKRCFYAQTLAYKVAFYPYDKKYFISVIVYIAISFKKRIKKERFFLAVWEKVCTFATEIKRLRGSTE